MTTTVEMHKSFDNLLCCLIATRASPLDGFREIKFINYAPHDTKLLNPKYIAIHAAVAHVLHLSGAVEILDSAMEKFFKGSVAVPAGKLDGEGDMQLWICLMNLADDNDISSTATESCVQLLYKIVDSVTALVEYLDPGVSHAEEVAGEIFRAVDAGQDNGALQRGEDVEEFGAIRELCSTLTLPNLSRQILRGRYCLCRAAERENSHPLLNWSAECIYNFWLGISLSTAGAWRRAAMFRCDNTATSGKHEAVITRRSIHGNTKFRPTDRQPLALKYHAFEDSCTMNSTKPLPPFVSSLLGMNNRESSSVTDLL
ncbi:hypothetical protein BKA93DRAFT_748875 [Sparassis latifolia]